MPTILEAGPSNPGPDHDQREWHTYTSARLEVHEMQAVGKPYRYLEGRAVPFDTPANVGWYMESHAPASFDRSVKGGSGKNAPLLLFHDNRGFPIGHAEKWTPDADGLTGVWKLNDSPDAQRAAAAADDGDLLGLSIGFQPIRSTWELVDDFDPTLGPEHMDRCTRTESRLLEVSMTPTPAFADAQVSEVRGDAYTLARAAFMPARQVDAWLAEVERLRSGPNA